MKVGLIARADRTGLGNQTRFLARLLKPDAVLMINSKPFNGNDQFPLWYKDYNCEFSLGFPSEHQVREFLEGVDVVISCETFYRNDFTRIAKEMGKKTILIANYEFFDWHKPEFADIPLPDKVVMPSYWHLEEMQRKFNATYLPTPLFVEDFALIASHNINRTGPRKYLFVNGKSAIHDRNGLQTLYDALKYSKGDFQVTIKAQHGVQLNDDPRILYDFYDQPDSFKLYKGYDAMIMPRRYAGQCLPMTEALQSALPVIMTDIDPNNKILPPAWLVPAYKSGQFMTRTMIDIYSAEPVDLAYILDNPDCGKDAKKWALQIGKQYDAEALREKYEALLSSL